jgi:hypothetical protein
MPNELESLEVYDHRFVCGSIPCSFTHLHLEYLASLRPYPIVDIFGMLQLKLKMNPKHRPNSFIRFPQQGHFHSKFSSLYSTFSHPQGHILQLFSLLITSAVSSAGLFKFLKIFGFEWVPFLDPVAKLESIPLLYFLDCGLFLEGILVVNLFGIF